MKTVNTNEVKPNRAERRRLEQGKGFKNMRRGSNRFVNQNALQNAFFSAPTDTHFVFQFVKCRYALERICDGTADSKDWDLIAVTLSVSNMRAKRIDSSIVEMINLAVDAMRAASARKVKFGRYGFSGPEISAVREALDACEVIISSSSQHQLNEATEDYKAKTRNQNGQG